MITRDCRIYLLLYLEERKVTFGLFWVKNMDGIIEKRISSTHCLSASVILIWILSGYQQLVR